MSFSKEWDDRYQNKEHLSVWPWSNLVTFALSHTSLKDKKPDFKVLEIGCGAGANIPFFQAYQADYHAIEGSPAIVSNLHQRFPEYAKNITSGDFTKDLPFEGEFDLIVDRAAITHNTAEGIKSCLALIHSKLKDSGVFIGVDWFTDKHEEYQRGEAGADKFTRTNYVDGPFANLGNVHYSTREHLDELFENFSYEYLERTMMEHLQPEQHAYEMWQIIARKK